MSPLRQPRRSVSNAMGAVSSITEDLVAFPSNGGPDRRHLHDGGAPDHQKLELRPRAGQNHIRLPQSIPQITRNLNPNGKSQFTSIPFLACAVALLFSKNPRARRHGKISGAIALVLLVIAFVLGVVFYQRIPPLK